MAWKCKNENTLLQKVTYLSRKKTCIQRLKMNDLSERLTRDENRTLTEEQTPFPSLQYQHRLLVHSLRNGSHHSQIWMPSHLNLSFFQTERNFSQILRNKKETCSTKPYRSPFLCKSAIWWGQTTQWAVVGKLLLKSSCKSNSLLLIRYPFFIVRVPLQLLCSYWYFKCNEVVTSYYKK